MLKYRAISFPLLLGLLYLIFAWPVGGERIFFMLAPVVAALAAWELTGLLGGLGLPGRRFPAALAAALVPLALLDVGGKGSGVVIAALIFLSTVAVWLPVLVAADRARAARQVAVSGGAVVAVLLVVLPLMLVFAWGKMEFLILVLVTKAGDTGGYIVGRLANMIQKNGNHKMVPTISPKKSWEGTIGGLCFSIIVAFLFAAYGQLPWTAWYGTVLLGAVLYGGGLAGDLTESCLKRACGVKDSGHWIPGMGGVLDVVDSFIYNAPLYVLYWAVIVAGGW